MCGICGYGACQQRPAQPEQLARMNQALLHRGPDDSGQYTKDGLGIAMRRLAVIDLSGGAQPMSSPDRRVWVVLNGEIYNFQDLRRRLITLGHSFRTTSDTEVLLAAYLQFGDAVVDHLSGMFAFAILDTRDGDRLFLGRDRFGEKPLFYTVRDGVFVFSSELRSLLLWDDSRHSLDWEALGYFMRFAMIPSPRTLFSEVMELGPGQTLTWRDGQLATRRYFQIEYNPNPLFENEDLAAEVVNAALKASVKRQAYSDVPSGAFLSGGIDSSLVVSYLAEVVSEPVQSFTARFQQRRFDEGPIAREVSERVGTTHNEILIEDEGFRREDLLRVVDHVGQPMADSSAIPTYHLSAGTRRSVTVAFSGDGGDELFAGYNVLRWLDQASRFDWFSRPLARAAARMTGWLGLVPPFDGLGALRKLRRGLELVGTEPSQRFWQLHSLFSPAELDLLFVPEARERIRIDERDNLISKLPEGSGHWSPLRQAMYFRLCRNLPLGMLAKVDRMSMACSLETRLPMLDPDLAAISFRLPDRMLLRGGKGKHILRKLAQKRLPASVLNHPKTGFDIPLHTFQNDEYRQMAHEMVLGDRMLDLGFRREALSGLVGSGIHQKSDRSEKSLYRTSNDLWAMMELGTWLHRFNVEVSN